MAKRWGRIVVFLLAAEMLAASTHADPLSLDCLGETSEAGIARSVDARSLRLDDGRTLRLAGIEPFDVLLPGARDAEAELQSRLAELIEDRALRVQLLAQEPDRYGRPPAMVWAGKDLIQEVAVREGLAVGFANGVAVPCFDRILAAEDAARRAHRGFWKGGRLPWAFPAALASRIGHFTIFEGRVLSVGNRPTRSYLNFGYRWTEDVTVEIADADRASFGGEAALAALAGHRVRVRGYLEERGGPMVVISSPMQLEALDSLPDGKRAGAPVSSP